MYNVAMAAVKFMVFYSLEMKLGQHPAESILSWSNKSNLEIADLYM